MVSCAGVVYIPEDIAVAEPFAGLPADRIIHYHFLLSCTTLDPVNMRNIGDPFFATPGSVNLANILHILALLSLLVRT